MPELTPILHTSSTRQIQLTIRRILDVLCTSNHLNDVLCTSYPRQIVFCVSRDVSQKPEALNPFLHSCRVANRAPHSKPLDIYIRGIINWLELCIEKLIFISASFQFRYDHTTILSYFGTGIHRFLH